MKKFLLNLLFIIGALAICSAQEYEPKPAPTVKDFMVWVKEHGHLFDTNEFRERFKTFVDNHFLVEKLNQIYNGKTEFKLSKFAHMTPDEFKSKILMRPQRPFEHSTGEKYLPSLGEIADLPDSFDWRDHDAVTPVKDQGSVGTCWAFSTIQNLEGQYKLKGNPLTNLSVEQVVDCDGTFNVTSEHADCGVYGGWPYLALQYVKEVGGIESEDDYPYCAGSDKPCSPCSPPGYNDTLCGPPIPYCYLKDSCQAKLNSDKFVPNLKVVDWMRTSENETDIAVQLMNLGPMSAALNAQMLQFYHKGIFDPIECDPQNLDHAILLVGWGVEHSKIHGTRSFWIVKNSWGPKWGENGYFRILKEKGKCGINTQVVTAFLE